MYSSVYITKLFAFLTVLKCVVIGKKKYKKQARQSYFAKFK